MGQRTSCFFFSLQAKMLKLKRQLPSNKKYFTDIQELSEIYDDSDNRSTFKKGLAPLV